MLNIIPKNSFSYRFFRKTLKVQHRYKICLLYTSKGFGSDAVFTITDYLNQKYNVRTFFMCPSKMNVRAICAYKKAGFRQVSAIEKQSMIQNLFTYDEIQSLKQDTECFSDEFVFMIKLYDNEK